MLTPILTEPSRSVQGRELLLVVQNGDARYLRMITIA